MGNNILITGTPRSGTTLTCHLLNRLPDVVALHEPMRVKDFVGLEEGWQVRRVVERFCEEQRESILTRKRAISKNVGGIVPDNPVGTSRSGAGLRQRLVSRGEIPVEKEVSPDFTMVIKHNAGFTALLDALVEGFPVYAVVRNPLATIASWSSVEFGVQRGRVPAAEQIDPDLKARLDAIDGDLERQIYLLDWFHGRFHDYLPAGNIIPYETIIESEGKALKVIRHEAAGFDEPLESRNASSLYDAQAMLRIGERLLASDGAYWRTYTRESVERLLVELETLLEDSSRSPAGSSAPEASRTDVPDGASGPGTGAGVAPNKQAKRETLLRRMPSAGTCAEVGVWEGDLSATILEVNRPSELHLIDPWRHETDPVYSNAWYGGKAGRGQEQLDAVHYRVTERFAAEVDAGTVFIHRAPSAEAASLFEDGYFDWVYIDANHLYEFIKADLELWYPKVSRGGYLTGTDYVEGRWWKGGVKRAVDEFCESNGYELETVGRQFVIRVI